MQLVVAGRPDGLGTRLLTILHARSFAERIGADLKVLWPSLNDPLYDTSDLLQEASACDVFAEGDVFLDVPSGFSAIVNRSFVLDGKRVFAVSGAKDGSSDISIDEFRDRSAEYDVVLYDLPFAFASAGVLEDVARADVKRYWRTINFNQEVLDAYRRLDRSAKVGNAMAIHFRRGDIERMPIEASVEKLRSDGMIQIFQRYLPLDSALEAIRIYSDASQPIIICSENQDIAGAVSQQLRHRTVIFSGGEFAVGSTKRALLDLMVMANCQTLISPPKSYFSECASAAGTCNYYATPLNPKGLVAEIVPIIEASNVSDKSVRLAMLFATAWQNMWHEPGDARDQMLTRAKESDRALTEQIIDRD